MFKVSFYGQSDGEDYSEYPYCLMVNAKNSGQAIIEAIKCLKDSRPLFKITHLEVE